MDETECKYEKYLFEETVKENLRRFKQQQQQSEELIIDTNETFKLLKEEIQVLKFEKQQALVELSRSLKLNEDQHDRELNYFYGCHNKTIINLHNEENQGNKQVVYYKLQAQTFHQFNVESQLCMGEEEEEKVKKQQDTQVALREEIEGKLKRKDLERLEIIYLLEISKQRCEDLQKIITTLEKNNEDLKRNVIETNEEFEETIIKLQIHSEFEKNQYAAELNKLKKDLEQQIIQSKEEIENLKKFIDSLRAQHNQQINKILVDKDKQTGYIKELENLKKQLELEVLNLKNNRIFSHEQFKQICENNQKEILIINNQHNEDVINLQEEYYKQTKKLNLQIEALQGELKYNNNFNKELQLIIKNLGDENNELEQEIVFIKKKFKQEIVKLQEEIEEIKKRYREEIEQMVQTITNQNQTQSDIQSINQQLEQEIVQLHNHEEEIKARHEEMLKTLQLDFNKERDILNNKLNKKSELIDLLKQESQTLKSQLTTLQLNLKEETKNCEKFKEDSAMFQQKSSELESTINELKLKLEESVETIASNMAAYTSKIQTLEEDLQRKTTSINNLERLKQDLEKINHDLLFRVNETIQQSSTTIYTLQQESQLAKLEHEKEEKNLKQQLLQQTNTNNKLEETNENLQAQIKTLKSNLTSFNRLYQEEIKKLKKFADDAQNRNNSDFMQLKSEFFKEKEEMEKNMKKLEIELKQQILYCKEFDKIKEDLEKNNRRLLIRLDETKSNNEEEIIKMKIFQERSNKYHIEEMAKLRQETQSQARYCDDLEKSKQDLEQQNRTLKNRLEEEKQHFNSEFVQLEEDYQKMKKYYENEINKLTQELNTNQPRCCYETEIFTLEEIRNN